MDVDVSVVIPSYNSQRFVAATLASVLGQSYSNLEVVVVNDGSTDNSPEIVERIAKGDPRVRLMNQENKGVAPARNAGLAATSSGSQYVLFLDADDLLEDRALELLLPILRDDPSLVGVVGLYVSMDENGIVEESTRTRSFDSYEVTDGGVRRQTDLRELTYWHVLPICPIATPGQCLLRRSALPHDPFQGRYSPSEDWELWLRLARRGSFGILPETVVRYRDHASSASKSHKLMQQRRREVFASQRPLASAEERSRFRRAYSFCIYGYDVPAHWSWSREALLDRRPADALRYALRATRYTVGNVVSKIYQR